MSVLNVLDTTTVSGSGTAYIVVKSGVVRAYAASASTIKFDEGPAITLAAGEAVLLSVGKAKNAKIAAATDAATMVITAEGFSGGGRHTFSVGDYIETVDGGDTDGFTSDFESAASGGKTRANTAITTLDFLSSSSPSSLLSLMVFAKRRYLTRNQPKEAIK